MKQMKFLKQWQLSLRLLWREARSGELSLMAVALLLAVTSTTAIALFSARLDLAMQQRANDILGADLRLEATTPIGDHWYQRATALGLTSTTTVHFPTVVLRGDAMAMVALKAVTVGYPLQGELSLQNPLPNAEPLLQRHGPSAGEAWAEPRLLALLDAQLGDVLEVGRSQLRLRGIIAKESDRDAGFYSFSPRLMINSADLDTAALLSTGSRAQWRLLLNGSAKALAQLQQYPVSATEKFQSLQTNNEAVFSRLSKAQRYLGLAAMLAVVLACVAVAISAKRYAERHFDISALMRTFGLTRRQVFTIYALQLLQLGLVATVGGLVLAVAVQQVLLWLLVEVVPAHLPSAPFSAWLLGASSGLIGLLGFALPYLMPLARVSPLKVLRRELDPVPITGWAISLIAMTALFGLLWMFTADFTLTALALLGSVVVLGVMFGLLLLGIGAARKVIANKPLPMIWRFAWQHLSRNSRHSAGQILAFALTLMVMILIFSLRNDLLDDWRTELPVDAPNVFAINLQPYELENFQAHLVQRQLAAVALFPTVPARLVRINQQVVADLAIASDPSLNRDLILSAAADLPSSNRLAAGHWHGTQGTQQVSVEDKLAARLGLQLGDRLTFNLAGQELNVQVSSLRTVDWGSMSPNFFMLLSPDTLVGQPITYMTSFYLPPSQSAILTELIKQFPSVTFFDTQIILAQIQTLLEQVTLAIEWILLFVLISALLVMLASLTAGLSERLQEGAMVRTLGGSRQLLRRAQMAEFSLLGALAALLALGGAELLRWVLYQTVLNLNWHGLGLMWLWLPPLAIMLLAAPALVLLRRTVQVPPLLVLRGR